MKKQDALRSNYYQLQIKLILLNNNSAQQFLLYKCII
jgi:hypothetical protein